MANKIKLGNIFRSHCQVFFLISCLDFIFYTKRMIAKLESMRVIVFNAILHLYAGGI